MNKKRGEYKIKKEWLSKLDLYIIKLEKEKEDKKEEDKK
jgi:hypothetical protein